MIDRTFPPIKSLTWDSDQEAAGVGARYFIYEPAPSRYRCVCYPILGAPFYAAEVASLAEAVEAANADNARRLRDWLEGEPA